MLIDVAPEIMRVEKALDNLLESLWEHRKSPTLIFDIEEAVMEAEIALSVARGEGDDRHLR